jgi:hypothetical protein
MYDLLPGLAQVAHVKPGRTFGHSFLGPGARRIPSAVTSVDRKGKIRTWSLAHYKALLRAAVARKVSVFGEHEAAFAGTYRIGPHPELVGRPVASLGVPAAAAQGVRWAPTDPKRFAEVKLSSGFLPIHMVGTIDGAPRGTPFALAVNGVVVGTGRVAMTTASKRKWVSIVMAERDLMPGRNTLDLLLLRDGGGPARVARR